MIHTCGRAGGRAGGQGFCVCARGRVCGRAGMCARGTSVRKNREALRALKAATSCHAGIMKTNDSAPLPLRERSCDAVRVRECTNV